MREEEQQEVEIEKQHEEKGLKEDKEVKDWIKEKRVKKR